MDICAAGEKYADFLIDFVVFLIVFGDLEGYGRGWNAIFSVVVVVVLMVDPSLAERSLALDRVTTMFS